MRSPLKIALGDLRHSTIGKHSVYAPLGIGFLASYLLNSTLKDQVEIKMFDDPDLMLECIDDWTPDVVGLANYCWNAEINSTVFSLAKEKLQDVITIAGGPEFPPDEDGRRTYLATRPQIDFYCPHEGEAPFSDLVSKIIDGIGVATLRSEPQHGLVSLPPEESSRIVAGPPVNRIRDLNVIPSPYVSGIMDQWLNGEYTPLIETARGCPFSCTFCCQGVLSYNKLATFAPERVGEEVRYIAEKLKSFPNIRLGICDSNFGMYPRDVEIAEQIGRIMDDTNWPQGFQVTTGKTNHERILEVAKILKNKLEINCATQSMDETVLDNIKRKNLTPEQYKILREHTEITGMRMIGEIIAPLPGETKESFFEGVKTVCNVGIEFINVYTTMMLHGTALSSPETRSKYGLVTRYRCLPRQFGEYEGRKVFEVEEVCVETNTMSNEEYNACRGLALVSTVFASEQYDAVRRILEELGVQFSDFLVALHDRVHSGQTDESVQVIYKAYLEATSAELFHTKEELYEYYSSVENYKKMLNGDAGDNLLRRFRAQMHLRAGPAFTSLAIGLIQELFGSLLEESDRKALAALETWLLKTRKLATVFTPAGPSGEEETLELDYDVAGWYLSETETPLHNFDRQTTYRLYWDKNRIQGIIGQAQKMYTGDIEHNAARVIVDGSLRGLWRSYDVISH